MKTFYSIGQAITRPFYYLHKGLDYLIDKDLVSTSVMLIDFIVFIAVFLTVADFQDGEIINDIVTFLLFGTIFGIVGSVIAAIAIYVVSMAAFLSSVFAKVYFFFERKCRETEEAEDHNTGEAEEEPYVCTTDYADCGMND